MQRARVLIIEDEKLIRWSLRQRFDEEGYLVDDAETGEAGLACFQQKTFDLVMLDLRLPDLMGLDVLRRIRELDNDVVVVLMTAFGSVESAVEAMRLGAHDYVSKPFKMDELMLTVEKGLETTALKRQVRDFRQQMSDEYGMDRIIGDCSAMQKLFEVINDVADGGASTIFLRGESGTGKDLVAKTIHYNSNRADHGFVNITCTALGENLLESELFGHEKGAFTDAKVQKKGLLEIANGGTAYLDEVGDMPLTLQAKLLRFLEEKAFRRVGGVTDISVDVRIIAATNKDVEKAITEGRFREDLYYRLNIIPIHMPPLREREADVDLLTRHFVTTYAQEFKRSVREISEEAMNKLRSYTWPGNVRELRNAVERAVLLAKSDRLGPDDFVLGHLDRTGEAIQGLVLPVGGVDLDDVEEQLVRQALARAGDSQTRAAKLLSLSRDQLRYRMEKYGINGP